MLGTISIYHYDRDNSMLAGEIFFNQG